MSSFKTIAKVLLVDDLDENLLALKALLKRDDVEVLTARSGREALELLLIHDVALALLDVQMPEMDGFELAELMRGSERTRRVPIIFVTAGAREMGRVFRGYEVGCVDFLFKPIDPVLLTHKVTTFVELHHQRLEIERLAEERSEMLRLNEMFIAAISHDLRSPLSSVLMGASLLDADPSTTAGAKQTLGRVRSSAERMIGMLDQLYDLARARVGGGIAIDSREANFRALADKVFEELRLAFPDRTLVVTYNDEGSTTGVWDEVRVSQILANIVGNALRYGAKDKDVKVTIRTSSSTLSFDVHNGGVIPEETKASLFEPFRRGNNTKRTAARDSLGLGLFIAKQLVLAHGGTITCASSVDAGTTFHIELPRNARTRPIKTPPSSSTALGE